MVYGLVKTPLKHKNFRQEMQKQFLRCCHLTKLNNQLKFYSTERSKDLLALEPSVFIQEMNKAGLRRAYLVFDSKNNTVQVSHPLFEQMAQSIVNDKRDFLGHEAIFIELGQQSNALLTAFIQKSVRGIPQGGVRLWHYNTIESVVRDGLRLSAGMGRKNALSYLWWGGGKGIIVKNSNNHLNFEDPKVRDLVFGEYGDFLTGLRGCYYGAEDVGLTTEDTARMFKRTRFMTCIPEELGGSGNPSQSTGLGVVCGMEAALDFLNMGSLKGKKVVIQGAGNVANFILERLLQLEVGRVIMSDINEKIIAKRREQYKEYSKIVEFRLVPPEDNSILLEPCDIVAPCALGGILNGETIPKLNCKIVAGAANNQLLDPVEHDHLLKKRGILYVPDYLLNRMGIVNCANEGYGYVKNDPMILRHFGRDWENSVYNIATSVFKNSQSQNIPTGIAAHMLADEYANQPHPIWGHRAWQIIQSLIADKWAEK
jgi:leucine dehydrogenase